MITIGKVAALANVTTDTLRYYKQEDLISLNKER
jgi:DNA-binding transcriptional MerR regulator